MAQRSTQAGVLSVIPLEDITLGSPARGVILLLAQRFRTIAPSQTGRRLIETTLWSVVAEGLSRGLLLLSMVVVARTLGAESYGEFGMVRSTISVFAVDAVLNQKL